MPDIRPPQDRGRASSGVLAILMILMGLGLASCEPTPQDPRAVLELERMAFLPAAATAQLRDLRGAGAREALLVDLYEVTRREWRHYLDQVAEPVAEPLAAWVRGWEPETDTWPASFMNQYEAAQFARWRGMRLLTAIEWSDCGLESATWLYPWGTTWQDSVANTLELRLERPTPVGTFESGRSSIGCYDMLGNVAEWVAGADPAVVNPPSMREARSTRVAAMGGSFRQYGRYERERPAAWAGGALDPASRSDSIGLRCGVEAAAYLWEHAPEWDLGDAGVRRRLVALGRRWGRRSLPLLEQLAGRPGAPAGLRALMEGASQ